MKPEKKKKNGENKYEETRKREIRGKKIINS